MTTQVNVAKAFVLVVKHGEIDQSSSRVSSDRTSESTSPRLRAMFRVDEFRESLYALVGSTTCLAGARRACSASSVEISASALAESRHYPFVEFGREGISVYHLFPGDAEDSVGILVDFPYAGCLRKVTRVGRELRLGVRAKPRGFGTDDAWDPDDDKWVNIKFPRAGGAWYRIFFFASKSFPDLPSRGGRGRDTRRIREAVPRSGGARRARPAAPAREARRTFPARSDRLSPRDRK